MRRQTFASVFAGEINAYIDYKASSGFSPQNFGYILKKFDHFCTAQEMASPVFTGRHADEWVRKHEDESHSAHYKRINTAKNFLLYLNKKGFDVVVTRDVKRRKSAFQPHIYSKDEILRYFEAVDTFDSDLCKKDKIQYPIIFRILYCCGTRINETLGIRKRDIDLDDGIIRLHETKNN